MPSKRLLTQGELGALKEAWRQLGKPRQKQLRKINNIVEKATTRKTGKGKMAAVLGKPRKVLRYCSLLSMTTRSLVEDDADKAATSTAANEGSDPSPHSRGA